MSDIQFNRRTVLKLAGAAALTSGLGFTAAAQEVPAGTEFEVEGPISSISGSGNTGTIVAMGMTLDVRASSTLTSPSGAVLSMDQASAGNLPNRPEGFVGGTFKGSGTIESTDPLTLVVGSAVLEPAENVVFGVVTDNTGGVLHVNGVQFDPIDDPRMAFPGYTDAAGASLTPDQVPLGTIVSGEGYYAGGVLNIFIAELDFVAGSGETGDFNVSIARAEYRPDKNELRARGAASDSDLEVGLARVEESGGVTTYEPIEGVGTVGIAPEDNSWNVDSEGVDAVDVIVAQLFDGDTVVAQSAPFAVEIDD
ncbi:hypothetical protein [Halomarina litorea]|uniref:hypothetical protein n=1 Tax=Halomarina litorea TaxID=2961595 RepID=UPI0020C4000E|nr:hypothetical protein [Halomarina sp. BCD28]